MHLSKKRELLLLIIVSFFLSLIIIRIFSARDSKSVLILLIILFGWAILSIIPDREKILFCLCAFIQSLSINITFFYKDIAYDRPLYGFAVSAYDLAFLTLLSLWIYRILSDRKKKIKISFFPAITIPLFLIMFLSSIGLHYSNALLPVKVSAIWNLFKNWLVIIYLANNIDDNEIIYLCVVVLLLSGLLQSMIGIGQYLTGNTLGLRFLGEAEDLIVADGQTEMIRISGTFGWPNSFALFLDPLIQLNFALFFYNIPKFNNYKWYYNRLIYIVLFIPMAFSLFLTYSRSSWFSFILGGFINSSWCLSKRTGRKFSSIIIMLIFFIFFAAIAFAFSESVRNRLLMEDKGSADSREPLAQIAKNIIYHNPWFGVGLTDYQSVIYKYDNTSAWISYDFFATVHDEFLLIAAEQGIPVLIIFIYILSWLLITLFYVAIKSLDPLIPYMSIGLFSGLVSLIMHWQKDYNYIFFVYNFWFNVGLVLAMRSFTDKKTKKVNTPTGLKPVASLDS